MSRVTLTPVRGTPLRVRRSMGHPRCVIEHAAQYVWSRRIRSYLLLATTLSVVLQLVWRGFP